MYKAAVFTALFFVCIIALCAQGSKNEVVPVPQSGNLYAYPGVISGRSGSWVGSDHLFNLSNQIEVGSEIVKPESLTLSITNQEIDQTIRAAFSKAQITPEADVTKEGAPLPFFHVLVMVYPVKDQYVAYITGRLFESVTMKRAKFEGGVVFQGITWEDQNLMMASKENFPKEVQKNVDEIVNNFTGRYQYFEKIR